MKVILDKPPDVELDGLMHPLLCLFPGSTNCDTPGKVWGVCE
jgi:hypothetical protein